jgi:hypothetical protein
MRSVGFILRDAAGAAPQDEVLDPHGEEARKRRLEPCGPEPRHFFTKMALAIAAAFSLTPVFP